MLSKRSLTSIFIKFSFVPFRKSEPQLYCLLNKYNYSTADQSHSLFAESRHAPNPQTINSISMNCSSDSTVLSILSLCARQPIQSLHPSILDDMIPILDQAMNNFKAVKDIVQQLDSFGCTSKYRIFLLLMRIYWRGRRFNMVLQTFEEMSSFGYTPSTFSRNMVMDSLFKMGLVDKALSFMNDTCSPNFLTFNIALSQLCKINDFVSMMNVLKIILRERYHLDAYTMVVVLDCFCKMGRIEKACQVLGFMITLGIPLSVNAWSILIDALSNSGKLSIAHSLLKKMADVGCSPNVVTCTSLIKGFLKSGMLIAASEVLLSMESNGIAPDLVLYNVLIYNFSKMGKHEAALSMFHGLLKQNIRPDSYTLSSCLASIHALGKSSTFKDFVMGLDVKLNLVFCNQLLHYFCEANHLDHAMKFYEFMLENGFVPDKYTFTELLRIMCRAGLLYSAIKFYRQLVRNDNPFDLDAHLFGILIDKVMRKHKFNICLALVKRAVKHKYPLDDVIYSITLRFFRDSKIEQAKILFNTMKSGGITPTADTFNVLVSRFCRPRKQKLLEWILGMMIESEMKMKYESFMRVSKFLFWRSNEAVCKLLSEMWSLGLMPDESNYPMLYDGVKIGVLPLPKLDQ